MKAQSTVCLIILITMIFTFSITPIIKILKIIVQTKYYLNDDLFDEFDFYD